MIDLLKSASGRSAEQVARLCAEEASRIILGRFGHREVVQSKGRGNFTTQTDLAVESAVLELMRAEYPDHALLSEERWGEVADWQRGWLWVVDPIDGTHNFSQGIPHFCFTIALCHDGEPVLALTYAPVTGEEFFAQKGGGLLVNGERAHASATASLAESVLGVDLGYDDSRAAKMLSLLRELWPGVQSVRVVGSAALGLAFAACGRFDVFVHNFLFPWDLAAGILLVQEGRGLLIDRDEGPVTIYSQGVVAGAPGAAQDFLRLSRGKRWR